MLYASQDLIHAMIRANHDPREAARLRPSFYWNGTVVSLPTDARSPQRSADLVAPLRHGLARAVSLAAGLIARPPALAGQGRAGQAGC